MKKIAKHISEQGKSLVKYRGAELTEKLGSDVLNDVVSSILTGGNVRTKTEKLTQRRIALSNASMLMTFVNLNNDGIDFEELYDLIEQEINGQNKLTAEEKNFLMWIIGLTGKSIQNVLRGDKKNLKNYIEELNESLDINTDQSIEDYGELEGKIEIDSKTLDIDWKMFLRISIAIGTQALALRGAEKAMYGKFFEKLILGVVLSILDFEYISSTDTSKSRMVFWLSERGDKRESDATLLYEPGKGIRFDIGFIGVGNTEITLDKVTRFEKEMDRGSDNHLMKTIIIIDRVGDGSRILEMAKKMDGSIIQMSMTYWVYELAELLRDTLGYEHEILTMKKEETINYIEKRVLEIDLSKFLSKLSNNGEESSGEDESE